MLQSIRPGAFAFSVLTVWVVSSPAHAQATLPVPPIPGTISSHGIATLSRKPEVLRMQVELTGKGKDLKAALALLKDAQNAAQAKSTKLDPAPASFELTSPTLAAPSDRQSQMEAMMGVSRGGHKSKTSDEAKPPVTLSSILKAEWNLKGGTQEELMLHADELQEMIKRADLAGKKTDKVETEEEEEEEGDEEMRQMRIYSAMEGSGLAALPGDPVFTFVCKIPDTDRANAMKEAFENARKDAERLAAAANARLGSLQSLSCATNGNDDGNPNNPMRYLMAMQRRESGNPETADDEAVSKKFEELK